MNDYRHSHDSLGYGEHYDSAYLPDTFDGMLWERVERPLLLETLTGIRKSGAESCLDFACGTGRILASVEQVFPDTVGVDVSESMLSVAKENVATSTLELADITKDSLGRRFDCATAFRFFRNAEPDLRRGAIDALAEHLNPGASLVVNTHGNPSAPSLVGLRFKALFRAIPANTLSATELTHLLESGGFTVVSHANYAYLPRLGSELPSWYTRLLGPAERLSAIPVLRSLSESTLVVAVRR